MIICEWEFQNATLVPFSSSLSISGPLIGCIVGWLCCFDYNMKDKVEFVLFVNPANGEFYSFSPSRGLLAKEENVPRKMLMAAQWQLEELRLCMDLDEPTTLTTFQRRPIPLNLLIESSHGLRQGSSSTPCTTPRSTCLLRLSSRTRCPRQGR